MPYWVWWLLAALAVCALLATLIVAVSWKRLKRFATRVHFERAQEMLRLQRGQLNDRFMLAASSTGKPRGLRWKGCDWEETIEFVIDKKSQQILAFAGVTIHFEAIEGSDMEEVEAVGLPRNATAVFYFQNGQWETNGDSIMNKNPDEAAVHFGEQYEILQ